MPVIYKWTMPVTVSQDRYDGLILRPGYFAVPTPNPGDGTIQVGGVPTSDVRLGTKVPIPRAPKILTNVTSMQTGHGWTASGALTSSLNDTTDFALGSQSAVITSKTDTTAATITKTGLSLDLSTTKQLRLLVKVTGGDYISQCLLYWSSDGFAANYANANIQGPNADPSVRMLKDGEWHWITVNVGSGSITNNGLTTGTPNLSAITDLRIRLVSTSGNSTTFRLQAVQVVERKSFAAGGIVCLTYDDSMRAQSTIAKAHLDKYGWAGTAFTIDENIKKGDAGDTNYLTTAMLRDLRKYSRWEVGLHSNAVVTHGRGDAAATSAQGVVYGTNPLAAYELDAEIDRNFKFLEDNDLTDGYPGYAYPLGRYNTAAAAHVANRAAYARAMTGNSNGLETVPVANPFAIRSYVLDNTTTYSYLQTIIDAVALHGGMAVFTCHDIVTTPTTSTQFSTAIHQQLIDYIATKTGIRVMTLGDVIKNAASQDVSVSVANVPGLQAALDARPSKTVTREINANDPVYGTPGTRTAFINALDAAEALGLFTKVRIPAGLTIDVGTGLSMSGRSAQIIGDGAGWDDINPVAGSVIKASGQTGPVIDFTGYQDPLYFWGQVTPLAGVAILGNNAADATKVRSGIKFGSISSAHFRDLLIGRTGGPCLELAASPGDAFYLNVMERITCMTPVSAGANNVPYVYINEANGNVFRDFVLRSIYPTGAVGVTGAIVVEGNASFTPYENSFENMRFEYLNVPTNGTLFQHAGNRSRITGMQIHDCAMETGATSGTSFIRLVNAIAADNYGGNTVSGTIWGDNEGTTYIHAGVDVRQNGNRIIGMRDYGGANVKLASGVNYTYAHLSGSISTPSATPAFVDNSGTTTNTLIDSQLDKWGIIASARGIRTNNSAAANTAILQGIINSLPVSGSPPILFDAGVYPMNPLVLGERSISFKGVAPHFDSVQKFGNANWALGGYRGTWFKTTATTGTFLTIGASGGYADDYIYQLDGIGILGPGSGSSTGVTIYNSVKTSFQDVMIANISTGLKTDFVQDGFFRNLSVWGCETGIYMDNFSNQNVFINTDLRWNKNYALRLEQTDTNTFLGGVTEVNNGTPIYFGSLCRNAVMENWYYEDLQIDWPSPVTWMIDCPGSDNNISFAHLKLHSNGCGDIRFSGNGNAIIYPFNGPNISISGIGNMLMGPFFPGTITDTGSSTVILSTQQVKFATSVTMQNVSVTPPTPTDGVTVFAQGGYFKCIGSSGTVTTLGPA